MKDSFSSAFIFFRAHKGAAIFLTLSLSLIFFACLYLHALSRTVIMSEEQALADVSGLYTVNYQPADQTTTEQLINVFYQSGYPIEDLNIYGDLTLLTDTESTFVNVTQDMTGSISSAVPSADVGSISTKLIGISDDPDITIDVVWGTDHTGDGEVLFSEMAIFNIFGIPRDFSADDVPFHFTNGESMKVAGIVNLRSFLDYEGVIVRRADFFDFTDNSSSVQVLFSDPLTAEQERQWILAAKDVVTISDIKFPVKDIPQETDDSRSLTLLSRICVLACLLCAMRLMAYLFLLRQQELTILRILGARLETIQVRLLVMVFIVSGISIAIGMSSYLLLLASGLTKSFLPVLHAQLLVEDTLFFAVSILIIGFYMFSRYLNFDVSHASEEV